ncbi:MAG: branched-chain amino acid ABC transporter permease [Candidatus Caldatribacteriota bacterium]|nr:branched-chain amino acid ABC transporter permease [Candidatus Caldatribacteriota bacterium]
MKKNKNIIIIILAVALSFLLPSFVKNYYWIGIFNLVLIYSILCLSLNLIFGFTNLLSVGHAAFYGIGAYTTAILLTRYHFAFFPALILSGVIAVFFGLFLGISTSRVRGDYFTVISIVFGEIFRLIMQNWISFSGGAVGIVGIPAPQIFSWRIISEKDFYFLGLILFWFTYITLSLLVKSKLGRAFIAIREDELAASTMGIHTIMYKILSFSIGCFYAGLAGSYYAVYNTAIAPSSFTLDESCLMIIMVVLGGIGNLTATISGVVVMLFATEVFRPLYHYRLLLIGLIMVIVLVRYPYGILGIFNKMKSIRKKYNYRKV